ncbi:uncharacterized protein LOC141852963 [Brevipalpus obovatus]|uniref:uncharacterized protein LOC141852963 n=1 Tax=Brevipalpus obovatus TaxID=246614 RepID=UPI003D9DBB45
MIQSSKMNSVILVSAFVSFLCLANAQITWDRAMDTAQKLIKATDDWDYHTQDANVRKALRILALQRAMNEGHLPLREGATLIRRLKAVNAYSDKFENFQFLPRIRQMFNIVSFEDMIADQELSPEQGQLSIERMKALDLDSPTFNEELDNIIAEANVNEPMVE